MESSMSHTAEMQAATNTPADLVRRIGDGDRRAEETLVKQFQRPLLELLRYRTHDPELAQDLLQDTLTIIIRRLREQGLNDPDKLVAYMHRTAHNLVIAHFRKEARRDTQPNTELVEVQQDPQGGQLAELLLQEEGQLVRDLLEDMRVPRDREVLLRFYVWEQEKALVCQAMGLRADQFDRVVSRARQRFRALLEEVTDARD
jgi:RNA polymerase sigma-70 factor (ECF subfamily)